jgi:hypothetical protein
MQAKGGINLHNRFYQLKEKDNNHLQRCDTMFLYVNQFHLQHHHKKVGLTKILDHIDLGKNIVFYFNLLYLISTKHCSESCKCIQELKQKNNKKVFENKDKETLKFY